MIFIENKEIYLSGLIFVIIFIACILYMFIQKERIEEAIRERLDNMKNKNIYLNGSKNESLENRLNILMAKIELNVDKSAKASKVANKKMSFSGRVGGTIIKTINNPYNNTNVVKIFFMVVSFSSFGFISGILLRNPAMGLSCGIMGLIMPFTLTTLTGLKRKMSIMNGNLHFMSVHLANYLDSPTFEKSLTNTLKNLTPNTLQYNAVRDMIEHLNTYNFTVERSLEKFRERVMAEKYMTEYTEIVLKAESNAVFKNMLSTTIKSYEYLVRYNLKIVNFSYWIYIIYMISVGGLILVTLILSVTDPELYKKMTNELFGQLVVATMFGLSTIIGMIIAQAADLINLEVYKRKDEDDFLEDGGN